MAGLLVTRSLGTQREQFLISVKTTTAELAFLHRKERHMERIHITQHTSLGALWFAGWLFTIGYLHLDFLRGLLGLVVWPYFLGSHLAP
jgi:hypothetical protein